MVLPKSRSDIVRYALLSKLTSFWKNPLMLGGPCLSQCQQDHRVSPSMIVWVPPIRHDLGVEIKQACFTTEKIVAVIPILESFLTGLTVGTCESSIKPSADVHMAPNVAQQLVDVLGRHMREHGLGPDHVELSMTEDGERARLDSVQFGPFVQEILTLQPTPALRKHLGGDVHACVPVGEQVLDEVDAGRERTASVVEQAGIGSQPV